VLPRQEFKDWTKPLYEVAQRSIDANAERRQWHSGCDFWVTVLLQIFEKMGLSPIVACHVRHWTLHDSTLAMAVMQVSQMSSRQGPQLGFAGVTWKNFIRVNAGIAVAANNQAAFIP
jgi:hypothetical protein